MNRFDIINRIGDKYRVGNTETGEFSYAQALKSVGKDIKVVVVTCDDFSGVRRSDRTFKDDLPAEELGLVLKIAEYCIISTKWR